MFNIDKYLEKFSKRVVLNDQYIQEIKKEIKNITNIDIDHKDIEFKNCVVYLKCNPSVKNKVFIYKKRILDGLSKKIDTKIIDII